MTTKKTNKKKVYLILAILAAMLAFGTAFAYIMDSISEVADGETIHGTEVGITVEIDDFSEQILMPQGATATEAGETATLEIEGTIALDYSAGDTVGVNVDLAYAIYVDDVESTHLFEITNETTNVTDLTDTSQGFSLDVSLVEGKVLADGAIITVVVTATLSE